MNYIKTKYPNIFSYETNKGKRYYIRRSFMLKGKKKEVTKSGLKSLGEARAYLSEIERKIEGGDYKQDKNLTLDQYWEKYAEKRISTGRWTPDTERNKTIIFRIHLSPTFGKVKLKDLDRESCEDFVARLLTKYTRQTVIQTYRVLMAVVNDAVYTGYLYQNTLQRIYIGESKKPPYNKKVTVEQFKQWNATARELLDDYRYLMVCLPYFSLRASEVYGIKLKTHHLREDGLVELRLTSSRTRLRDDNKDQMKTKGSRRTVVLDSETSRLYLKAVDTSCKIAQQHGRILSAEDYLLLSISKNAGYGKLISTTVLRELYEKVSTSVGIHITPHMMRHFYATQGVRAGVSIEHMAAVLGHSTSYMTERYTHIQDEVSASVTENVMRAIK